MGSSVRAIETTGTINPERELILDESFPIGGQTKVRVIVLLPEELDVDEMEWLRAAAANPAFDFLKEPKADIYTLADGEPFDEQR